MALMGAKKQQMFPGLPPLGPYNTPGIGDGDPRNQVGQKPQGMGQLPDITNMPAMMLPQQPAKFKPDLLGVLGDAAQVFAGGQATYMQGVREQQQREQLLRQRALERQQERETGWQDWVKKEEYKRANPDPANNDTANDWDFWEEKLKSGRITQEQFNDRMFPAKYILDQATGQTIKIGGGPSYAPAPQGVTFTPVKGGQTATPSGNFPRR